MLVSSLESEIRDSSKSYESRQTSRSDIASIDVNQDHRSLHGTILWWMFTGQQKSTMEQEQEEIEINFKLNAEGRTIQATPSKQEGFGVKEEALFYESHSIQAELWCDKERIDHTHSLVDELLYDCEISDCGLMPRTFWISANATARCSLEQMAKDVFQHHVSSDNNFDEVSSGAEWWVQIRPSPEKVGRYAMHDSKDTNEDDDSGEDDMAKEGISFHWDKDEDLRILCGGTTYIHPHLSTVTYLSAIGAPTLALNLRIHNLTGEWVTPNEDKVQGFLSWPRFAKHLSFDGRYLHAAPSNLMEEGTFAKQIELPEDRSPDKKLKRRYRRVTFLVNIWLNYKPFNVNPFPETMITKMSGHQAEQPKVRLLFAAGKESPRKVQVCKADTEEITRFAWPMGNCKSGETIKADIPLTKVREEMKSGGSLELKWQEKRGAMLSRESKEELASLESEKEKDAKKPRLI